MNADQETAVREALDKLVTEGDADQIAAYLAENDHQGRVGVADACPVSNYLYATLGERVTVDCEEWIGGDDSCHPMPAPIGQFISRFDMNGYPALIEVFDALPDGS